MNKKNILLSVFIMIALLTTGCKRGGSEVIIEKDYSKLVVTEEVKLSDLNETYITVGLSYADKNYEIRGIIGSEVKEVLVEVGDLVLEDQVLFTLENDVNKRDVDNNKKNALTQLEQSRLSYNNAKENYDKNLTLYNNGGISKVQLDSYKLQLDNSKLTLDNANTFYYNTIQNLNEQLDNSELLSPINGIVVSNSIVEGGNLSDRSSMSIIDLSDIIIKASVSSDVINQISVGQDVEIEIKSIDKKLDANITSVSYLGEQSSYIIEIKIENTDGKIKPGMYSNVNIILNENLNIVVIPKTAILKDDNGEYVYVDENKIAVKKYIETSETVNGMIGITNGINQGESIVIEGHSFLKEGDELRQ